MSSMRFFALSEKGLRDNNEDCLCAERIGDYSVFAVADGLGGHECGEVASSIAIECLKNAVKFYEGDIRTILKNAVSDANEHILAASAHSHGKRGMATTLIAACMDDNLNCTLVNVGDSRAHIMSGNVVTTTKDHSYVSELLESGKISPEEAWHHPLSNVLSQALGDPEIVIKPDFYELDLHDTFLLLSSDGLHDFVTREKIQEIVLANGKDVGKSCKDLVKEAQSAGSDDNISVVLVSGANGN